MKIALKPLREQVIVITGASSGIGLATAEIAAREGAKVVLASRDGAALAEIERRIRAGGGEACHVAADVGVRPDVQRVADTAVARFGGFDTWVNDAGVSIYGRLEQVSEEDHERLFRTNFWGVVNGSLVAVAHLKTRGGGALINVGSVASDTALPLQGMYSASKHAIKGFTDALRIELEEEGAPVSVTLIKPAAIDTPIAHHARNYMDREPDLPPPVYPPQEVANAILHAAATPTRDIFVGGAGKAMSALNRFAPRVMDWAAETAGFGVQKRAEPPRDPQGALHRTGRGGGNGRVRGDHPGYVTRTSLYTRATLHPVLTTAAVVGVGLAAGAVLLARDKAADARPVRRPSRPSGARSGPSPAPGDRRAYVRYAPDVERIEPDEAATFERIVEAMRMGGRITRERYGRSVRTSHAKAHGLLKGELRVLDGLPPELRQGLFAEPRTYPVIVRLAHVPGELFDDRKVSTPRGLALKVLEVAGEMLPGHRGERTQDWVLDSGPTVFVAPGAKTFLAQITAIEAAAALPQAVKGAVSAAALAANKALNAVGLDSANLDFYGHPPLHPLGEAYYSQCPMRYGDYVAKLGVFPDHAALRALIGQTLDIQDEDGLRRAVVDHFRTRPAEYVIGVQLCTDLKRMPVENAMTEWPEDESPYRPVARLVLPPQEAYSPGREAFVDEALSFCPAHSLAAHRPLGSIMRARMHAYEVLGRERREQNGQPTAEPRGVEAMPG